MNTFATINDWSAEGQRINTLFGYKDMFSLTKKDLISFDGMYNLYSTKEDFIALLDLIIEAEQKHIKLQETPVAIILAGCASFMRDVDIQRIRDMWQYFYHNMREAGLNTSSYPFYENNLIFLRTMITGIV